MGVVEEVLRGAPLVSQEFGYPAGIDCEVGPGVVVSLSGKGVIKSRDCITYYAGYLSHGGEVDGGFDGEFGLVSQLTSETVGA